MRLRVEIVDRPGVLARICDCIGQTGGNIIEVYHQRMFYDVPPKQAEVDVIIETRSPGHIEEIIEKLKADGFTSRVLSARSMDPGS